MCLHDNTAEKKRQDHLTIASEKRKYSIRVASMLETSISREMYYRVLECGRMITMLEDDEQSVSRRYDEGYYCKHRMCPACAWRKSMGLAVQLTAITGALVKEGCTPLLVTLTAPNCTGPELSETILRYNRAWNKLLHLVKYKNAWANHVRKFEITYNAQMDTYHPHLHIIVYVRPGYFKGKSYISREQLLKDWRKAYRDPNITQIDLRRSYGSDGRAIAELSKYAAKASDYLYSQQVFDTFNQAICHKRMFGYSGRCKELRAAYKAGKLREYIDRDTTAYAWRVIYEDASNSGDYVEAWRKPYDASVEDDLDIVSSWVFLDE